MEKCHICVIQKTLPTIKNLKTVRYRFIILSYNTGKDGKTAVTLRITKNRKRKYINTGLRASPEQWDTAGDRFVTDRRLVPGYKAYNTRLSELEARVNAVLRDFDSRRIDWTLNQFETEYLGKTARGSVKAYFDKTVVTLRETEHIGNAICYSRVRQNILRDRHPVRQGI